MKKKNVAITIPALVATSLLSLQGCNERMEIDEMKLTAEDDPRVTAPITQVAFDLEVRDADSNLVYQESLSGSNPLRMESGRTYRVRVNSDPGARAQLTIPNATVTQLGHTEFQVTPGLSGFQEWSVTVSRDGSSSRTRRYLVQVPCSAAQAAMLSAGNPGAVTVTTTNSNRVTYSAAGLVTRSFGTARCAWDFNGDGILDSTFPVTSVGQSPNYGPCATTVDGTSNHFLGRDIRISVIDDCGAESKKEIAVTRTLAEPTGLSWQSDAEIFIRGTVASGSQDPRTNLRHSSVNRNGLSPVNCSYSRSNGIGSMTINGRLRYGASGAENHGFTMTVTGISDSLNLGGMAGAVSGNASTARISSFSFRTDRAMDLAAHEVYSSGSACVLNDFRVLATPIQGVPCSGSGGGSNNGFTVLAAGRYQCMNVPLVVNGQVTGSKTVDVSNGDFVCYYNLVDQCIGGGGGGGGGIAPIQF